MMADEESEFGSFEYECQACDVFGPVDDVGLCEECSAKLDRDMLRQRAWDYSASAFGMRPEDRERLRAATIAKYGDALELVAPDPEPEPRVRQHKRRRKQ
jgi:hypothetical protein